MSSSKEEDRVKDREFISDVPMIVIYEVVFQSDLRGAPGFGLSGPGIVTRLLGRVRGPNVVVGPVGGWVSIWRFPTD